MEQKVKDIYEDATITAILGEGGSAEEAWTNAHDCSIRFEVTT